MPNWNYQRRKHLVVRWLGRAILMLLAVLVFTHGSILSTQPVTARESASAALRLTTAGKQLYELGKYDSAAQVWQQAADIYEQLGDRQKQNQSLINVAEALQANGIYLRACNVILQTFALDQFEFNCRSLIEKQDDDRAFNSWFKTFQPKNPTLVRVYSLHSFGDILQKLGRLDLSDKVLQKGLQIARQLSSPQTEAAILLSLGNNQQILGDRLQDSSQNLLPKQNNLPLTCPGSNSTDVIPFYRKTLLLYQQSANKFSSPTAWLKVQLNRLSLLLKIGDTSGGVELTRQILPVLQELPPESNTIYTRINLAKSLICLKNSASIAPSQSEIAEILTTAVKQAQDLEDRRGESYALGYLGWLYEQERQIAKALSFTQQALFLAQAIQARDIAYKWQWQLGYLLETQGDRAGAIAAYSDAVDLLQLLRRDLIAVQTKTRFYFQEQVEPVYRKLVELLVKTQANSALKQDNLQQARKTIESLKLVELENFLQQACLNPKIEIDRIVDLEDSTSAVIYPIILQNQLAIILKLPKQQQLRYYTTPVSQERLIDTISELESYLPDVSRTAQVKRLSQQIYDWLINPLENDLENSQIDTLVFVLDSFLGNIPMSVLYDRTRQQYLIEKYALSIAPSLQLIDSKPIDNSSTSVLAAGISKQRSIQGREFTSLINVRQELSQIQAEVSDSTKLIDNQFTKTNLQNQLRDHSFSIIHLATHSQFSSSLDRTFILVWEQLLRIEDLVNLLQVNYSQDFEPIELLVLSACQTAKGDRLASLGLAGITVRSGVSATLATLWSIDDFSTSQTMKRFYQELDNGMSVAKAIQKAQLAILKKEKRPYFWAPFILVGNWR